jgi:hypothetical protein
MTTRIGIEILHGSASVGDDDRERAEVAALAVCEAAAVSPEAAAAEYRRQYLAEIEREDMTGLALVWLEAERAADLALTEGWHNPGGASCAIDA